jgi:predicted NUDIX family NTP pyrophosphohydrolase
MPKLKQSAGILLYRRLLRNIPEVLLVHPGGPFWVKKDLGAWSIPKGEFGAGEDALATAIREFREETGTEVNGNFTELSPLKQKTGKIIYAWMCEGDMAIDNIVSNTFEMEWPPRSGKKKSFPEVDRAGWFVPEEALLKIVPGQAGFISQLLERLK